MNSFNKKKFLFFRLHCLLILIFLKYCSQLEITSYKCVASQVAHFEQSWHSHLAAQPR
jgi:hypothetical protein